MSVVEPRTPRRSSAKIPEKTAHSRQGDGDRTTRYHAVPFALAAPGAAYPLIQRA